MLIEILEPQEMINHLYQHFRGEFYLVFGVGFHTETGEITVGYRTATKEEYHFRPYSMWNDLVWHEGKYVPRFRLILP